MRKSRPKLHPVLEPLVSLWEKTKLGWTIMSPGKEVDLTTVFCTQTSQIDYDNLCKLDVLGLADTSTGDQAEVYAEFKEQFTQDAEGWYEMGLPWRGNHPSLSNNGVRTFRWLGNLVRKLRSQGTIEHYDQVIQDQIEAGIVERVSGPVTGSREFYIPHKPVVCESAETTKLHVVYYASAHAHSGAPLLNECLNAGLPFRTSCGVFWQKQSSQHLWRYLLKGHLSCTSGTQTWRSWRKHVQ